VEDTLRPVAVGRKYYLHLGGDRGGRMAAVLMSLERSGQGPGNAPYADMHDALNRVNTHPAVRVDDLSPDRRVLPGR
jgi:transposase